MDVRNYSSGGCLTVDYIAYATLVITISGNFVVFLSIVLRNQRFCYVVTMIFCDMFYSMFQVLRTCFLFR